jgi:uncharacterized repeat protein (TIGR02543 family)
MKRVLIAGLAVLFAFAMVGFMGCKEDDPPPPDNTILISFDLNWPAASTIAAPAAPAAARIEKGAGLTSGYFTYSGTRPSSKNHGGWFLTKAEADAASGTTGQVTVNLNNTFDEAKTLYARWVDRPVADTTGKDVEEITLANNYYPLYQFTLPAGKKWSDYKTVAFTVMVDDDNYAKSTASFRVYGNYVVSDGTQAKPGDFTYLTGTGTDVTGKKIGVAITDNENLELNKNGPYIMHNGGGAAVSSLYNDYGSGGGPDEWVTLTHSIWSQMSPHTQFTGAPISSRNMPAATDEGPFYLGVGLPNLTYKVKNVKLVAVSNQAADDVLGVPAIFSIQVPGTDLTAAADYKTFCPGYGDTSGGNGFKELARDFVNATGNSASITGITLYDGRAEVVFDYNYPAAVTTPPTPPADTTQKTSLTGYLNGDQLAKPAKAYIPEGYRFLGWYTTDDTALDDDKVSTSTAFDKDDDGTPANTIYAQWAAVTAATEALVINNPAVAAQGNNLTYVKDSLTWNVFATATWAADNMDYSGTYGSLSTYQFPDAVNEAYYEFIRITYATDLHEDGVDGDYAVIVKDGYGEWSLDFSGTANKYPSLTKNGTGTLLMDLDGFTKGTGFSFQHDSGGTGKANGWLLRITKVEFTTQDLIDAES